MPSTTLAEIARVLELPAPADAQRIVTGVGSLTDATSGEISMVSSDAYLRQVPASNAMALLVGRRVHLPSVAKPTFIVEDVELALVKVLQLLAPPIQKPDPIVDSTARIDSSATVGAGAAIGVNVLIGQRAKIGRNVQLHANVVLGDDVTLGDDCTLYPNVVVRERVTVGNRVTIHAGSVIGSDGFGYRWDGRQHVKVPQIGTVIIEDDVEVGSCVCIDRAKFGSTRIGRGTKIDNLVQIAHNVQVGAHNIIVAQSGIAGSARLGTGVVLGGQAAVRDHVTIGDGATAAARSAVVNNIPARTVVSGVPAIPHRQHLREQAALRHLPELRTQVRHLIEAFNQFRKKPKE